MKTHTKLALAILLAGASMVAFGYGYGADQCYFVGQTLICY